MGNQESGMQYWEDQIEHLLPGQIEARSFALIDQELDQMGIHLDETTGPVIRRAIHTTADFDYAKNLVFSPQAVEKGIDALCHGGIIITDTNMAKAGINKKKAESLGVQVFCHMADSDVAERAREKGCTRAAASMEKAAALLREEKVRRGILPPVIFAVGNAPTALVELSHLLDERQIQPDLIIGVPVGFVNVEASKEMMISRKDVYYIVARGRKGWSNVAAAIVNALLYQCPLREVKS